MSAMSAFRLTVLALAITAHAAAASTPAPMLLTGSELKALCTIDSSTMHICAGYVAGVSDDLEITSQEAARTLGTAGAAFLAPCPGKQMAELVASTLKELEARPPTDPALTTVQFALVQPLGCDRSHPSTDIVLFADGDRLKGFCTGSDRDLRLQCEGYIRGVADSLLKVLSQPTAQAFKSCAPTWQTPDQAASATIVYLNAHPEHGKVPAPTLISAALLSPSCPLAPISASPDMRRTGRTK